MRPLLDWPLWVIGLILMVVLSAALQFGYWLGRRIYGGTKSGATREGLGYIISASMALLGLLLAFTFGASQERFNIRRRLIEDEANAFRSSYMVVQSLDEARKAALSPLIVEYCKARVLFFEATNAADADQADARSDRLQDAILARALDTRQSGAPDGSATMVVDKLSRLFEVDATRRAEHFARVPLGILQALMAYAVISVAVIGMALSGGTRHPVASFAFLFVLTTTACMILGLDRQKTSAMLSQQAPMERTLAWMQRWETARLAGAPPPPGRTGR